MNLTQRMTARKAWYVTNVANYWYARIAFGAVFTEERMNRLCSQAWHEIITAGQRSDRIEQDSPSVTPVVVDKLEQLLALRSILLYYLNKENGAPYREELIDWGEEVDQCLSGL